MVLYPLVETVREICPLFWNSILRVPYFGEPVYQLVVPDVVQPENADSKLSENIVCAGGRLAVI
jgi:hypothetical protein